MDSSVIEEARGVAMVMGEGGRRWIAEHGAACNRRRDFRSYGFEKWVIDRERTFGK